MWYRSQGFGLDSGYPYESGAIASDSPGLTFQTAFESVIIDESFDMYLMFKPSSTEAIWVPIKKLNWGWDATAEKINGTWQIVGTPTKFSNPPTDVTTHPQWSKNALNIPFSLEQP